MLKTKVNTTTAYFFRLSSEIGCSTNYANPAGQTTPAYFVLYRRILG